MNPYKFSCSSASLTIVAPVAVLWPLLRLHLSAWSLLSTPYRVLGIRNLVLISKSHQEPHPDLLKPPGWPPSTMSARSWSRTVPESWCQGRHRKCLCPGWYFLCRDPLECYVLKEHFIQNAKKEDIKVSWLDVRFYIISILSINYMVYWFVGHKTVQKVYSVDLCS